MSSITRARFGAIAAAAALVAGGLLTTSPALADEGDPTISLANTTYTAGSWGDGLDVSGAGFTPDSLVTITVSSVQGAAGDVLGTYEATADDTGAFEAAFTPENALPLPAEDGDIVVGASSDAGDIAENVTLDVRAAKGITASTLKITTKDLVTGGLTIVASGYTPGETVSVGSVYNGKPIAGPTAVADRSGTVTFNLVLRGVAESGKIVFTLTGETSDSANEITVEVVGEKTSSGTGSGTGLTTKAGTKSATKLPVVSG